MSAFRGRYDWMGGNPCELAGHGVEFGQAAMALRRAAIEAYGGRVPDGIMGDIKDAIDQALLAEGTVKVTLERISSALNPDTDASQFWASDGI
jgi:hypothetical protein